MSGGQNQNENNEKPQEELVYDLDSGEMLTREEYNRKNKERQMEGIDEEDEDYNDEDDDDN